MLFSEQGDSYNLPDIFLIGAAKSGTTTLAYFIDQHPEIAMPRKEPGFMAYYGKEDKDVPALIRDRQVRNLEEYKRLYSKVPVDKLICDASVASLSKYPNAIANIQKLYGSRAKDLKMAAILRQPVERSFSHYMMLVKNGTEELSFEDAIMEENVAKRIHLANGFNYLENSLYYERVKAFKDAFPQLQIYLTEDMKDPQKLCEDLFDYLELDYPEGIDLHKKMNPSGMPKRKKLMKVMNTHSPAFEKVKQSLPSSWRRKLVDIKSTITAASVEKVKVDAALKADLTKNYFSEDIDKLEQLLGRSLDNWRARD